jgi:hypothetical protein
MLDASADPELVRVWLGGILDQVTPDAGAARPPADDGTSAPNGMDQERFQLHLEARQLAADEKLDYADAAVKILDRRTGAIFS